MSKPEQYFSISDVRSPDFTTGNQLLDKEYRREADKLNNAVKVPNGVIAKFRVVCGKNGWVKDYRVESKDSNDKYTLNSFCKFKLLDRAVDFDSFVQLYREYQPNKRKASENAQCESKRMKRNAEKVQNQIKKDELSVKRKEQRLKVNEKKLKEDARKLAEVVRCASKCIVEMTSSISQDVHNIPLPKVTRQMIDDVPALGSASSSQIIIPYSTKMVVGFPMELQVSNQTCINAIQRYGDFNPDDANEELNVDEDFRMMGGLVENKYKGFLYALADHIGLPLAKFSVDFDGDADVYYSKKRALLQKTWLILSIMMSISYFVRFIPEELGVNIEDDVEMQIFELIKKHPGITEQMVDSFNWIVDVYNWWDSKKTFPANMSALIEKIDLDAYNLYMMDYMCMADDWEEGTESEDEEAPVTNRTDILFLHESEDKDYIKELVATMFDNIVEGIIDDDFIDDM